MYKRTCTYILASSSLLYKMFGARGCEANYIGTPTLRYHVVPPVRSLACPCVSLSLAPSLCSHKASHIRLSLVSHRVMSYDRPAHRRLETRRRSRPCPAGWAGQRAVLLAAAAAAIAPRATGFQTATPARWTTSHGGSGSAAPVVTQQQRASGMRSGARYSRDRWALKRCASGRQTHRMSVSAPWACMPQRESAVMQICAPTVFAHTKIVEGSRGRDLAGSACGTTSTSSKQLSHGGTTFVLYASYKHDCNLCIHMILTTTVV